MKSLSMTHIDNLEMDITNIEILETMNQALSLFEKEIELFKLKERFL